MSAHVEAHLEHASAVVADLDRSIDFYGAAFGYTVAFRDDDLQQLIASMVGQPGVTCALAQLTPPSPGPLIELIAFPETLAGRVGGWGEPTMAAGQGHFGFAVADLDAAEAVVSALGAQRVGDQTTFPDGRSAYWTEPGGSTFELSEPPLKEQTS